jgi:alpha-1,3-rhamnosyltransferase
MSILRYKHDTKSKVAVCLLTYNHSDFIIETLKSIKQQSFKNFDLFVSDDKSTDDTYYKTKSFLKKNFFNYKLYRQTKNIGVTRNCNFLLKKTRSKYKFLVLFAGDDLMTQDRLRLQINCLQKNPNASFCYSNCYWVFNSEKFKFRHFHFFQKTPKNFKDLIEDFSIPTPTIMYNGKFMRKILFDESFTYLSDMVMVLNLWKESKPVFLNRSLTLYRRHQGSMMISKNITHDRKKIKKFILNKNKGKYNESIKHFEMLILYSDCIAKLKNKINISFAQYIKLIKMVLTSIKWSARCVVLTFFYFKNKFTIL